MKKTTTTTTTEKPAAAVVDFFADTDARCETCLHCKREFTDEDSVRKGVCFRFPPVPMFRPFAGSGAAPTLVRPIVKVYDEACGEWKARK